MRIDLLGATSVTVRGHSRDINANKPRAILAALALDAGRVVSHADLADELWGCRQPRVNARNAMQAHATRLRKVLDEPADDLPGHTVLRAVGNGYLLDVPAECVDTNEFLALAARGADLLPHPERAMPVLQEALRLWRGPALVDAGDGLRCRSAAEQLEERRVAVWEDLVTARLSAGDERQAVVELRALVGQYPLRERFTEQLMLALYRSGRQCEALAVFDRTRRCLDHELGVQPGRSLQRRHAQILAQDPDLLLPAAVFGDRRPEPARTG